MSHPVRSSSVRAFLALACLVFFLVPFGTAKKIGTVSVTPHASYSSSVGVLGCKIDTNRVAYFPSSVSCSNICIRLSYEGRSLHLLRIDQSQGAYDVSYDAWNYLYTGKSARDAPVAGGGLAMEYEEVEPSKCRDLIKTKGHKLPLSAANSMNFLVSCIEDKDSWVGENHVLYNIIDSSCTMGHDEVCELDYPAANQAQCGHMLGDQAKLEGQEVIDIMYPSGDLAVAGTGQPVDDNAGAGFQTPGIWLWPMAVLFFWFGHGS